MATREVAREILAVNEFDARDRKLLTEHTRRVSKALRVLKGEGVVKAAQDARGNMAWSRGS